MVVTRSSEHNTYTFRISVGKPERRGPLERTRNRYDDIKMNRKETGCGGVLWIRPERSSVQLLSFNRKGINVSRNNIHYRILD